MAFENIWDWVLPVVVGIGLIEICFFLLALRASRPVSAPAPAPEPPKRSPLAAAMTAEVEAKLQAAYAAKDLRTAQALAYAVPGYVITLDKFGKIAAVPTARRMGPDDDPSVIGVTGGNHVVAGTGLFNRKSIFRSLRESALKTNNAEMLARCYAEAEPAFVLIRETARATAYAAIQAGDKRQELLAQRVGDETDDAVFARFTDEIVAAAEAEARQVIEHNLCNLVSRRKLEALPVQPVGTPVTPASPKAP